jgi:hypothetical protein
VSIEMLENCDKDYTRLIRVMTSAREAGEIEYEYIVDRSRPAYEPNVFDDVDEYLRAIKKGFRKDYWKAQPKHVEVWAEKDAVIGSIDELTDELGVTVRVYRGFNSTTRVNEIATILASIKKPTMIFYLGDHDASGREIERDGLARVRTYLNGRYHHSYTLKMKRLAIHAADIQKFKLPPQRVKLSDTRAKRFLARYKDSCVELEALPPVELRRRLRAAVEAEIDNELWNQSGCTEKVELASIKDNVSRWPTLSRPARLSPPWA